MYQKQVAFLCLLTISSLYSKEEPVLASQQMIINPLWQYLDAGKICLRPGGTIVTNNGCYRQPDENLHYPAGYYFGGQACSEMMSSWLPIDFEHIYIKNKRDTYRIVTMIKSGVMKNYDSLIKWAIGSGILGIASLAYYFQKLCSEAKSSRFSASYSLPGGPRLHAELQANNRKELLAAGLVITGLVSLGWSAYWAVQYYLWRNKEFLSQADRDKLIAAIKDWPDNVSPSDYPLIAFEKTLTPGATEGLLTKNFVTGALLHKDREVTVYELDPKLEKR